jgi:hypothetical protein
MANERLIKDLKDLRDGVERRMKSKARLYSKVAGDVMKDVTDEQIAEDSAIIEDLERIIERAKRD